MTDNDVLATIKENLRLELATYANEQIDKLAHKFVCEMGKHKAELISALINQVEIMATKEPLSRNVVFQIVIKGDGRGDR